MTSAAVVDRLSTLADPTRARILYVLDKQELTVSELCTVMQLPQSTVSRHLKVLSDDGWVTSRADGTSRFYRREMGIDASGSRLWELVADDLSRTDRGREDLERIVMVLARRRASSREFFATSAGEWERMRAEIYGDRSSLIGLLGGWDDGWVVGDLGCGTGHLTMLVAPFVKHVIAVDAAAEMLDIARERAVSQPNVEFRTGELERLPLDDCSLDVVLFALVLQNVAEPEQAVREASRVLRPAGRMLIIDAMPHDREELRRALGNVWQGFSREQIAGWCAAAGFRTPRYVSLPLDPAARGPALFVATSRRP